MPTVAREKIASKQKLSNLPLCSVYAIIHPAPSGKLDCAGLAGHEEIQTIAYRDVAAIVVKGNPLDLTTMSKEELLRALMAQQTTIERLITSFDVLPVKFGTQLSPAQVLKLLKNDYNTLRNFLAKFTNKVQTELIVTWDVNTAIGKIAAEPDVVALVAAAKVLQGPVDSQAGIKIGQLVESKLRRRKAALAEDIQNAVSTACLKLHVNPNLSDQIVVNLGLLLESNKGEALEKIVDELDERFDQELFFKLVGPLPPYSFATVRVETPDFEALDQARTSLGLPLNTSLREINNRYRDLARIVHPDLATGNAEAFRRLTGSHRLLHDYWMALIGDGNSDRKCTFSQNLSNRPLVFIGEPQDTTDGLSHTSFQL